MKNEIVTHAKNRATSYIDTASVDDQIIKHISMETND